MAITIDTFTGKRLVPFDPDINEIELEDIAHALSNICRFGGHCSKFYSVAEHSVHVSKLVETEFALDALMHDATEAYIGDLVRPIKHLDEMAVFRKAEDTIYNVICKKFNLTNPVPPQVKTADKLLLNHEKVLLLPTAEVPEDALIEDVCLKFLSPTDAKEFFLNRFKDLTA